MCKGIYGEKKPFEDMSVTSGICNECMRTILNKGKFGEKEDEKEKSSRSCDGGVRER